MLPAAQCISNGFSCIQSTYFIPKDAVKIEAEGKLNGGDRAPYYIMDRRARLKHLKVGEVMLSKDRYRENVTLDCDIISLWWNTLVFKYRGKKIQSRSVLHKF